jgi:S1-C subfamily serine protease
MLQPNDNPYDHPTEPYMPGQNAGQVPGTYTNPDEYQQNSANSPTPDTYAQNEANAEAPNDYRQNGLNSPAPGGYYGGGMGNVQPNGPVRRSRGPRAGAIIVLAVVLLIVLGVGLFAGWEYGHSTSVASSPGSSSSGQLQQGTSPAVKIPVLSGNNMQTVQEAVIQKVSPEVVQVNVTLSNGAGIGSGVIIDKRGYIVTNDHVVTGAQSVQVVLYNGAKQTAQIVGTDSADDLAVLKINPPSNMAVATLGDSSKLVVGQDVLAIGNPLGITQTVTNGIISALNRTVTEGQGSNAAIPGAIQTDAAINPGNSGGALVDLSGNVIGIPTLTAIDPEFNTPASGVGFAIPSSRVNFIATQIIQSGHVTHTGRAALGIDVYSVDPVIAAQNNLAVNQGVLVVGLQSGGPAAQAGLKVGDVIVQISGTPVTDQSSLENALLQYSPGNTVAVHVYRGSQQLTVNVKLGELSASS